MKYKVRTPDQLTFYYDGLQEAEAFMSGFRVALYCYGVYKDGVQVIGCRDTPIKIAEVCELLMEHDL